MRLFKSIWIVFLLLHSIGVSAKPTIAWKPNLVFGESFYPSYAISTSTFKMNADAIDAISTLNMKGDLHGQIGIEVSNLSLQDYTLKVQIECDDLIRISTEEISVSSKANDFFFYPHLDYKWETLRKIQQNRPVTVKISVWVDGKLSGIKLKTFSLQSINNCPFTCITKSNKLLDLNYMYAAYVNEDNPIINDVLLKEMFTQGAVKQVDGYQSANPKNVYKQVFAVWNMLRKRGISYSSLSASTIRNGSSLPIVFQQYVRTFEDALQSKQANCVDGTVLMASILYRMGLQPIIVVTPVHCFLGYAISADQSQFAFLETTALGADVTPQNAAIAKSSDIFDTSLAEKFGNDYTSFVVATLIGMNNYKKDAEHFNSYSTFVRLNFITEENRSELIDKLQYQIFLVDKFKKQGLQSIFK